MKLVTSTGRPAQTLGETNAVRLLCEAGFDGIDYSMFGMVNDDNFLNRPTYRNHVTVLRNIAESYGVTFEQSHAPFPSAKNKNEEYNRKMFERLKRSIEIAGILDAKIIVIHPVHFKRDRFSRNMELYSGLEPYARDYGVKIAVENIWGAGRKNRIKPVVCSYSEELNEYVDALGGRFFTACLDLGHCGLVGRTAENMIRETGRERLGCLHIHDNDGLRDLHTLPYTGVMNWDNILRALGEIDYRGNFTLEADNFLKPFPAELYPEVSRFMAKVGRNMMSRLDGFRKTDND